MYYPSSENKGADQLRGYRANKVDSMMKRYTYLQFNSSSINLSLSLKHCNEFIVDNTSGSKSSTVGITDVWNQKIKQVSYDIVM